MRIKDIAREAGVSTATVSNVLNRTKYVTETTQKRVFDAVRKFNFHPNAYAQTLATGRSNIIGLLVSDLPNPFFPEIVKSVETAVYERGYNLFLLNTNYDAQRAVNDVRKLLQLKVAGIILMTSEFDREVMEAASGRKTPIVFHDVGTVGEKTSNICLDYAAGIDEAVRHLVSLGHQNIAHIAGEAGIYSADIRRKAFLNSMKRHLPGGPKPRLYKGDFRFEGGRNAASRILATKDRPTAIIAANDLMAIGAMQEFKAAGLRIPRDMSIVGFDDIAFASYAEPPLTTVCSPRTEIGRRAVEALLSMLGVNGRQGVEIRIPTHLVVRASTAPPCKSGRAEA